MKTAILSDIHGNSPALRAVLADIRQAGCKRLVVLGDVIAGFDPRGCLDLLSEWGEVHCILGNAEAYLITPYRREIPDQADIFYQELFDILDWFEAKMTPEQLDWVKTWPGQMFLEGAFLVHDHPLDRLFPARWNKTGLPDHYQELYFHSPGLGLKTKQEKYDEVNQWMQESGNELVFVGHTHEPFIRKLAHGILCNAGSAGTPLDGIPRPSWILASDGLEKGCPLEIRRVNYDIQEYTSMINALQDHPQWRIPGRGEAYRRMVETGLHWKAFVSNNEAGLAQPTQNQEPIPTHSDESHVK